MRKKLKWIALTVVVLLVVGLGVLYWNLNSIVRAAVEKGTGKSLALKTDLGSANLRVFSGDVALGDLKIANPEGFKEPALMTLGGVSVDTSYGKVFGDPVAINSINIDRPRLTIEFKGMNSNLQAVAENLRQTQQGDPGPNPSPTPPPTTSPAPTDPAAKPIKLIIDQLAVSGAQVEIVSDVLGLRQTIDIPAINLQAIGNADGNRNGEEIGKVVSQVITALTIEAQKTGKLPPELATILTQDLDGLIDQIGGQFEAQAKQWQADAQRQIEQFQNQATEQVRDVQRQAEQQINSTTQQATDEIQRRLGGILGGGQNERR